MSSNDHSFVSTLDADVMAKIREIMKDDTASGWDMIWQKNLTPWLTHDSQPPLHELIESGAIDFPRQGRALVPGCGLGYDTFYLASTLNLEVIGLDISEIAITKAKSLMSSFENLGAGKVSFISGDFYHYKPDKKFDLIYDYTFFPAIPPTNRTKWAQQMGSLIKPGGYLISLVFPIDSPTDAGPPFFVRVEHYDEVLGEEFEKILEEVPTTSLPSHVGKEKIAVWKRI